MRNFQEAFDARKPYYVKKASESKKKMRIVEEQRKVARMKLAIKQELSNRINEAKRELETSSGGNPSALSNYLTRN